MSFKLLRMVKGVKFKLTTDRLQLTTHNYKI